MNTVTIDIPFLWHITSRWIILINVESLTVGDSQSRKAEPLDQQFVKDRVKVRETRVEMLSSIIQVNPFTSLT